MFTLSCWLNHAIPRSCKISGLGSSHKGPAVKPAVARVQWKHPSVPGVAIAHLQIHQGQGKPVTVVQFGRTPGAYLYSLNLQAASCLACQPCHHQLLGSRWIHGISRWCRGSPSWLCQQSSSRVSWPACHSEMMMRTAMHLMRKQTGTATERLTTTTTHLLALSRFGSLLGTTGAPGVLGSVRNAGIGWKSQALACRLFCEVAPDVCMCRCFSCPAVSCNQMPSSQSLRDHV